AGVTASYTKTGLGPLNLSAYTAITFYAGFGSTGYFKSWGLKGAGPVMFTIQLGDGTHLASTHVIRRVKTSNNSGSPAWQKIRIPIPTGNLLNLAAITRYTITASSRQTGDLPFTDLYLDTVQAAQYASNSPASPNFGTVYDLAGIAGSSGAR